MTAAAFTGGVALFRSQEARSISDHRSQGWRDYQISLHARGSWARRGRLDFSALARVCDLIAAGRAVRSSDRVGLRHLTGSPPGRGTAGTGTRLTPVAGMPPRGQAGAARTGTGLSPLRIFFTPPLTAYLGGHARPSPPERVSRMRTHVSGKTSEAGQARRAADDRAAASAQRLQAAIRRTAGGTPRGPGQPPTAPPALRIGGADFSRIRVHTDPAVRATVTEAGNHGYALGSSVVIGPATAGGHAPAQQPARSDEGPVAGGTSPGGPATALQAAQARTQAAAQAALARAAGAGGQPLPATARAKFERSLGADLGGVRIHDNAAAAAAARAAGARAITIGPDIHFARGQYRPATGAGEALLAHEVAHTEQRPAAPPRPAGGLTVTTPASAPEREAGHAAARMIQGLPAAVSPAPAGMLFRFADLPVQIELDAADPGRVGRVDVGGRPPGNLEHAAHGSHTTPWSVFTESVRQATVGRSLLDAVTEMDRLFQVARNLPGTSTERTSSMGPNGKARYYTALKEAHQARDAACAAQPPSVDTLQRFISTFLEFRNLVPLTAVSQGLANYKNEGINLDVIRNYDLYTSEEIREAIFGMLDRSTLDAYISGTKQSTPSAATGSRASSRVKKTPKYTEEIDTAEGKSAAEAEMPGAILEESLEDRLVAVIGQHLQTVQAGFPDAYHKAGITARHIGNWARGEEEQQETTKGKRKEPDYGSPEDKADLRLELGFEQKMTTALPGRAAVTAAAPGHDDLRLPASKAVTVQLQLGPGDRITKVSIGGRPIGLFGTDDKKHATAWIAFAEGARARLEGKTIPEALTGLNELYDGAKSLPGATLGATLTQQREQEFNQAGRAADAAKTAAHALPSLDLLQKYARAYLTYRNFVPLSAADTASAKTKEGTDEARAIATVKSYRTQRRDVLREAFWGLLDPAVVLAIRRGRNTYGPSPVTRPDPASRTEVDTGDINVPGADVGAGVTENKRTADVVKQHLMTMRTNFPEAFTAAAFDAPSVAAHLGEIGKGTNDAIIPADATTITNSVWPL